MARSTRVHWTQTRKGKARLAEIAAARRTTLTQENATHAPSIPKDTFAYALGHVECWIDTYAKSAGVSAEALASRLGSVLSGKNRR